MSGTNTSPAAPDAITLDELERLIRILGMLGSGHDGEALNAARLAVRWLANAGTDWRSLLTPPEEMPVVGVGVADEARVLRDEIARLRREMAQAESREKSAYRKGVGDGLKTMAAQVKAQAAATAQPGFGSSWTPSGGGVAAPPVQPPAAGPAANSAPGVNPWPAGGWQHVAWELLESTVPGIFRGTREREFVSDVLGRGFPRLTSAQETWLRDIAGRAGMSW